MKYMLVISDGMADTSLPQLNGQTPIESLNLPAFNTLAGSEMGTVQTVPEGIAPGSDTAILNIFGYDPRTCYSGRSVLEAAGVGVLLKKGEVSFRLNLCAVENGVMLSHNGGGIEGDEAENLMNDLLADERFRRAAQRVGLSVTVSRTFRHIGVINAPDGAEFCLTEPHNILNQPVAGHMPKGALSDALTDIMQTSFCVLDKHSINLSRRARGLLPANMLWPWGPGRAIVLPKWQEKYGRGGTVISAVPLVWGIANLAGLTVVHVDGATGDLDTNYEGKADAALNALQNGDDFAAVHVEAPDEMAHAGSLEKKLEAIRRVDARVVRRLLEKLPGIDKDFRILLLSDHPTLLTTRTHDGAPVPYALYDSRRPGTPRKFSEKAARETKVFLPNGDLLMPHLFEMDV